MYPAPTGGVANEAAALVSCEKKMGVNDVNDGCEHCVSHSYCCN